MTESCEYKQQKHEADLTNWTRVSVLPDPFIRASRWMREMGGINGTSSNAQKSIAVAN